MGMKQFALMGMLCVNVDVDCFLQRGRLDVILTLSSKPLCLHWECLRVTAYFFNKFSNFAFFL